MPPLRPLQSLVHASPWNTASALFPQGESVPSDSRIDNSLGIPPDSRRTESALTHRFPKASPSPPAPADAEDVTAGRKLCQRRVRHVHHEGGRALAHIETQIAAVRRDRVEQGLVLAPPVPRFLIDRDLEPARVQQWAAISHS